MCGSDQRLCRHAMCRMYTGHSVPRLPKNGKNLSFIWKRSSENGWWCIGYVIWLFFWLIIFIFLNSYLLGLGLNYVIMAYWAKSLFWIIAQLKIIYWKWLWAWWKHILLHFIKKKLIEIWNLEVPRLNDLIMTCLGRITVLVISQLKNLVWEWLTLHWKRNWIAIQKK